MKPITQVCALDLKLNPRPFDLTADALTMESHQPGLGETSYILPQITQASVNPIMQCN